MDKMNVDKVGH